MVEGLASGYDSIADYFAQVPLLKPLAQRAVLRALEGEGKRASGYESIADYFAQVRRHLQFSASGPLLASV